VGSRSVRCGVLIMPLSLSVASSGVIGTPVTLTISSNDSLGAGVIVTPSDNGGGGSFSPTSITLTTGSPTRTVTYTATTPGIKVFTLSNNGGLTNPTGVSAGAALNVVRSPVTTSFGTFTGGV
jgi:hypothetical protein